MAEAGRIRNSAFRNQTRSVPLSMASRRCGKRRGWAVAEPGLSALPQAMGFDTIIRNAEFRIPAAPASQSGLHWATCERPSKRRGTAAFRRYRAVSVSGVGLQKCHSAPWSPRPLFGVSFLRTGPAYVVAAKRTLAANGGKIVRGRVLTIKKSPPTANATLRSCLGSRKGST